MTIIFTIFSSLKTCFKYRNLKTRFCFLTELSSQSIRPGSLGFSNQAGPSRESDATASNNSDLPDSRYLGARIPIGVFYQTKRNEYKPINQNLGAVVRNGHIIGRYDHGILRPIFNENQEMITVDILTHRKFPINSTQAAQLGMNLPIPSADVNRARIANRNRNLRIQELRNRHPLK